MKSQPDQSLSATGGQRKRGIIVGAGRAGRNLHYGAFQTAGAEILAFVDVDLERAKAAAATCGVRVAHSRLEDALKTEKPDFVSICTGLETHYRLACLALESGCHVLVEKPFTETLEEALALKKLSDERRLHLSVIHNRRFLPAFQKAVEIYRNGEIGQIVHVDRKMWFTRSQVRMMEPEHWAHRIPGGRLFEANPHNLYLLYQFMGPMELLHIVGSKTSAQWPHVTVDGLAATFKNKGEATAQLNMSLNIEGASPHYMIITGTQRSLFVDQTRCLFFDQLAAGQRQSVRGSAFSLARGLASAGRRVVSKVRNRFFQPPSHSSPIHPSSKQHSFQIERFVGYLEGRVTEPAVSWEEILEVQRLNEEMGRAAEASVIKA